MAVVTAEALPDEAVQRLQTALADYAEDATATGLWWCREHYLSGGLP